MNPPPHYRESLVTWREPYPVSQLAGMVFKVTRTPPSHDGPYTRLVTPDGEYSSVIFGLGSTQLTVSTWDEEVSYAVKKGIETRKVRFGLRVKTSGVHADINGKRRTTLDLQADESEGWTISLSEEDGLWTIDVEEISPSN